MRNEGILMIFNTDNQKYSGKFSIEVQKSEGFQA